MLYKHCVPAGIARNVFTINAMQRHGVVYRLRTRWDYSNIKKILTKLGLRCLASFSAKKKKKKKKKKCYHGTL